MRGVWGILVLLLGPAAPLFGHGVEARRIEGGVGLHAVYSDGEPMAFAEVTVTAPDGEIHQEGLTDRAGAFLFTPDTAGTWTLTADDGLGHRVSLDLTLDEGMVVVPGPRRRPPGRLPGAVTGVSLVFGLFGVWALWRASLRRASA